MQHEVTKTQPLLDYRGRISEEGWARHPMWQYNRSAVHCNRLRLKEWDYYSVVSPQHQCFICATISDLGYAALFALAYVDLKRGEAVQVDAIKLLPMGRLGLKADSGPYNVAWANHKLRLAFSRKGDKRRLLVAAPSLQLPNGEIGVSADLTLHQADELESMNIATTWAEKRTAFYLNEKINCMPCEGELLLGKKKRILTPDDAMGTLDWGRGRWTYRNRWYWGTLSAILDGSPFGFNIGYGFSDRTYASENAIFYQNKIHKFDQVTFHIPKHYLDEWTFTSNDGRFEATFQPIVDRSSHLNFLVIKSVQHQVFGKFSGKAVLDDGQILKFNDLYGFAEDVYNRF